MDNKIVNVICRVCSGKGGWSAKYNEWTDCGYCDGYGFHAQEEQSDAEQSYLLAYNGYRKQITELIMSGVANVDSYTTLDKGKTIELSISPYNRTVFGEFVKFVLKLAHFSRKIEIGLSQEYYYNQEHDKYASRWKLTLKPEELTDLDGFIDVLKFWDRDGGISARKS